METYCRDKTFSGPTFVNSEGEIEAIEGTLCTSSTYGIRPAMWLRIV